MSDEPIDRALKALELTGLFSGSEERKRAKEEAERVFASGNPWPMTNLPPELIDEILSHFEPSRDKRDLASLSLVSRDLPHIRPLLYSAVEFVFKDDIDHLGTYHLLPASQKLAKTIQACPDSANLIESFTLHVETTDPDLLAKHFGLDLCGVSIDEYKLPEHWVEAHKVDLPAVVLETLGRLPNLLALAVRKDSPQQVDTSFLARATLHNLRKLSCFDLNPAILTNAPNLKSLTCSPFEFNTARAEEEAKEWIPPPALEHLTYRIGDDPADSYQAVVFFAWLSRSCPATLQHLAVSFHAFVHFHLTAFSNLRTLEINLNTLPDVAPWVGPSFGEILVSLPPLLTSLDIDSYRTAEDRSPQFEQTYLVNLPPQLKSLGLAANLFHPNAILALLHQSKQRLPRLCAFSLSGQPIDMFGFKLRDPKSKWEDKHWEKVVEVCEEKGVACKV